MIIVKLDVYDKVSIFSGPHISVSGDIIKDLIDFDYKQLTLKTICLCLFVLVV